MYKFMIIVATKSLDKKNLSISTFGAVVGPGSGMDKNQDPG
jgi:hypothetical protein